MSPYEIGGVAFGVLSVWLIARQRVLGWPAGIVNVALFIVVFYQARLYADMGLQVVYVVLCAYGWYAWVRGGPEHGTLAVHRASTALLGGLGLAGLAGATLLGTALHYHTDASLPFVDAATTSFSLVAQWLQTRKYLENWVLWIAVDVVYVGMYLYKALFLTAGLYAVFLALAVIGLRGWRRSLAHADPAAAPAA
jgi:nicotinamide mononucleotide transporter